MEASGSPETRAGGGRALSVDILRRLEKSVDQIRYELIFSAGVGWPAVVEHGGGESVQGHAIRDVQQQPKHEGHDHTHSQRSPQNSHHENRQIHHTKEEFSKEALATSFVRGSRLVAVKPAPGANHHGVVDVVDVVDKSGPETSAEVGD